MTDRDRKQRQTVRKTAIIIERASDRQTDNYIIKR